MPKRKWVLVTSIAFAVAAGLTLYVATLQSPDAQWLPKWVSQVAPTETWTQSFQPPSVEDPKVVSQARRVLPINFPEFADRLNNDLLFQSGWGLTTKDYETLIWTRNAYPDSKEIRAKPAGNKVIVDTTWIHEPSWLQKAQQRFFGYFRTNNQ